MTERDDSARRAGESAGLPVSGVETDTQTEGAEVEALARAWTHRLMRHYGYSDTQIAEYERATHGSYGCEHQGYEWWCLDENDKPRHDGWDEFCRTAGQVMVLIESPELAAREAAAEVRGAQAVLAAVEAAFRAPDSVSPGATQFGLTLIRAAAAVTTSSAKSSDLATRVPQDESQRAAGGGGEA